MLSRNAAIAANRFGLGAGPGDAERIGRDGAAWLEAQLAAAAVADPASAASAAGAASAASAAGAAAGPESARVLVELSELRIARQLAQAARRAEARPGATRPADPAAPTANATPGIDADAIRGYAEFVRARYLAQAGERHRRAVATDRPFVERLTHFWSNHFAISADKQPMGALAGLYEREAIRPNVTRRFTDMLMAAERHPAMLLYLDNQASMGPRSTAAQYARRRRGRALGLNENLAREILELHTLGVDGGYGQHDVTELAKVLTGWSIGGTLAGAGGAGGIARLLQRAGDGAGRPGEFHFRAGMHEPGAKTVLGKRYAEGGLDEGAQVLEALALDPATARHLATKLARHFVADAPPASLIDRLARTYLESNGELVPVYRALIAAEECWAAPFAKYKTPHDFVISTYRALGPAPDNLERVTAFLTQLGQRPFTPGSPAGWPDTAGHWDSGDALLKRIEWGAAVGRAAGNRIDPAPLADAILGPVLGEPSAMSIARAESAGQGLALLFAAPEFQRR